MSVVSARTLAWVLLTSAVAPLIGCMPPGFMMPGASASTETQVAASGDPGAGGAAAPAEAPPAPPPRAVVVQVPVPGEATAGTMQLPPGFTPAPVEVRGRLAGQRSARALGRAEDGRRCPGRIGREPDWVIDLDQPLASLELESQLEGERGDAVIAVVGPDGVIRCDRGDDGDVARVAGAFGAGRVRVYVGTTGRGQTGYSLRVRESGAPPAVAPAAAPAPAPAVVAQAPAPAARAHTVVVQQAPQPQPQPQPIVVAVAPAPAPSQQPVRYAPRFGTVQLRQGFLPDPYVVNGASGGQYHAQQLGYGDPCRGWFATAPDHVLDLATNVPYLRIEASAQGDTTLIVTGPNGTFCDDDGAGRYDPRVAGYFPAGRYEIRVGSYRQGEAIGYQLAMSEYAPQGSAAVAAAPVPPPAPAPPQPVSDDRYRELLEHYRSTPMYSEQPGVARQLVNAGNWFSCAQIAGFVEQTHMYSNEVEVAATLFEHVTDRENVHRITSAFRMYSSAAAFRSRVGM